jgi:hypothetical protein
MVGIVDPVILGLYWPGALTVGNKLCDGPPLGDTEERKMGRALFGLIKGLIVGGGLGYCLLKLGNPDNVLVYIICGLVGAVVGVLCGQPPWRAETFWTPIIKMVFGFGVGAGLYALGHRYMPNLFVTVQGFADSVPLRSGALLATAIGGLYGLFVEVDDGGSTAQTAAKRKALPSVDLNDLEQ